VDKDQHQIRMLRAGGFATIRSVYEAYRDDLLTIAMYLLVDRMAAEDAVHDVFVDLATDSTRFKARRTLKGYLATCVANRARDQLRAMARRKRIGTASQENVPEAVSTEIDPLTAIIDEEETTAAFRALSELPYEQREVIVLHLHGSMTFKQIARQQDVSINTAQGRYRYGLDRLRSVLRRGVKI
jgi:RNA polymerase sigma-70 factor, ECF subfamily